MVTAVEKNQETRLEKFYDFLGRLIWALVWLTPLVAMFLGIVFLIYKIAGGIAALFPLG